MKREENIKNTFFCERKSVKNFFDLAKVIKVIKRGQIIRKTGFSNSLTIVKDRLASLSS